MKEISAISIRNNNIRTKTYNKLYVEDDLGGSPMIETTYNELVELRNSSKLVPGRQYRITDYECTTTQENTKSAGHQFDIIVTADSESVLSENARAINHRVTNKSKTYTGAIKLYKTDMEDFPDEVDTNDYFLLDGELIIDGKTYYKYCKYDNSTKFNYYIVLDTIDLENINPSLDNPYNLGMTYCDLEEYKPISSEAIVAYENGTITIDSDEDYFKDCNLAAWKIKYSLDNDTERFIWAQKYYSPEIKAIVVYEEDGAIYVHRRCPECDVAGRYAWAYVNNSEDRTDFNLDLEDYDTTDVGYTDTEDIVAGETIFDYNGYKSPVIKYNVVTEGKGVIYYMKDEWDNECPYDFKNIQFLRKLIKGELGHTSGMVTYVYTFNAYNKDNNSRCDATLLNHIHIGDVGCWCKNNTIKEYNYEYSFENHSKIQLNDIVFLNYYSIKDEIFFECRANTFGNGCKYNTLGHTCYSNTFGNDCSNNTFGNNCDSNTLGDHCISNTFGNGRCRKVLFMTSGKSSSSFSTSPEFWFNGSKRW